MPSPSGRELALPARRLRLPAVELLRFLRLHERLYVVVHVAALIRGEAGTIGYATHEVEAVRVRIVDLVAAAIHRLPLATRITPVHAGARWQSPCLGEYTLRS